MHPYSTDTERAPKIHLLLAVVAILLAWGLGGILTALKSSPPWWLDTPAVIGFFGIVWSLHNHYLWKAGFRGYSLAGIPDLSGRWHGTIESGFSGGTQVECAVTIRQTSTKIAIHLETSGSFSDSIMAALHSNSGHAQGLHYEYLSLPRSLSSPSMHPHKGHVHLNWNDDLTVLEGDYETDHRRGNEGRIRLVRGAPASPPLDGPV